MNIKIKDYTKECIKDVLDFENELRIQEPNTYFWDIDDKYILNVTNSFSNEIINQSSISLLAYENEKVIGRIDASLIATRFDGTIYEAYSNWICVLKNKRHQGVGQLLIHSLLDVLKDKSIDMLIILTAENEEATRFYNSIGESHSYQGITIKIL